MVFDSSNKLKTCLGRLDECGVGVEVLVALAVAMACRYVDGLVCVGVDHWFHVAGLGFGCFWQLLLLDFYSIDNNFNILNETLRENVQSQEPKNFIVIVSHINFI